jgi:hypothetical protein
MIYFGNAVLYFNFSLLNTSTKFSGICLRFVLRIIFECLQFGLRIFIKKILVPIKLAEKLGKLRKNCKN